MNAGVIGVSSASFARHAIVAAKMASSDHFSGHATDYAKFRPGYPPALFDWLAAAVAGHDLVWDCGCGNGQASLPLAERFACVVATDLSAGQLAQAQAHPRIEYRVATAEDSGLPSACCDLVAVAQALHWFDFDRFYAEARRVLKPGGMLAAWTYQLLRIDAAIDAVFDEFYGRVLAPWWPAQRRWVDDGYRSLPFPFDEIAAPSFAIRQDWALSDLLAYLRTWTATRTLMEAKKEDPTTVLDGLLRPLWGTERRTVTWPIAVRAGRLPEED